MEQEFDQGDNWSRGLSIGKTGEIIITEMKTKAEDKNRIG